MTSRGKARHEQLAVHGVDELLLGQGTAILGYTFKHGLAFTGTARGRCCCKDVS